MTSFSLYPDWIPDGIPLPFADSIPCGIVREEDGKSRLNGDQEAASAVLTGCHLIQAGAGTGKSSCLVARMKRISNIYPDAKVLMISFTKKSAQELRNRIGGMPQVTVTTFHSIAYHILKSSGWNFTVQTSPILQEALIRKLIGKEEISVEDVLSSLHREEGMTEGIRKVRQRDLNCLEKKHTVTFDTMQIFALEVLQKESILLHRWQNAYDFYLIDEFQDLDAHQLKLMNLMKQKCENVAVVGDERQSIYSFRGSVSHIMETFAASASCYELTVNYRSNPAILGLANRVMPEYRPLVSASDSIAPIYPKYLAAKDTMEEAEAVADEIIQFRKKEAGREIAILYRSSSAAQEMVEELLKRKIPFVCRSQMISKYAAFPYADVIHLFTYVLDTESRTALQDILPVLYLKRSRIREIVSIAGRKKIPLLDALLQLKVPFFHQEYIAQMTDAIRGSVDLPPSRALLRLLKGGYGKYVGADLVPVVERIAEELAECPTMEMFLHRAEEAKERMTVLQKMAVSSDAPVQLMSIHASKGMEFDAVFLIGCYDGCLPSEKEGVDPEEERRLLYVAVTRAKERLYVSYPKLSHHKTEPNEPSRFLREAFSVREQV